MVFTPVFTPTAVPGCENRCEHLRHGRDLMSDRTSGAWSTCSLGGLTAWKRPEPTKWAVVVIFCARATKRENDRSQSIYYDERDNYMNWAFFTSYISFSMTVHSPYI